MLKLLFLLFFTPSLLLAVLEIKPVEIGENPGFSGSLGLSLETRRGNTVKDVYKGDIKITYDNNKSAATWVQFTKYYAEANHQEYINRGTAHIRHVHDLREDFLCFEVFAQSQQDKFKSINDRVLGGVGLRWRENIGDHYGKIYLGLGAYAEYLNYLDESLDPTEHNKRLSSYIAYNIPFNDSSSLTYIGYFQPILDRFEDHYISQQLELKVLIYKQLYLSFKIEYDIDTIPATDREKEDFSQVTTFLLKF